MSVHGWTSVRILSGCAGLLFITGCVELQKGAAQTSVQRPTATEPAQTAVTPPPAPVNPSLAAVAEFLERTREYERPTGVPPSGTQPTTAPTMQQAAPATIPSSVTPEAARLAQAPMTEAPAQAAPPPDMARASANTQVALADHLEHRTKPAVPVVESLSLRPVTIRPPASPQETTNAANLPLDVQREAAMNQERVLAWLEAQSVERGDLASEWAWRLTQSALGASVDTTQLGSNLTAEARRILVSVINAAQLARVVAADPSVAGDDALAKAEELRQVLAERADPAVAEIVFCRKVVTFGVYDEMGGGEFTAGKAVSSILYSEIRNLSAERTAEGDHRAVIATRLELLTADGQTVWSHSEPEIVDLCKRRRTDFFIAQRITLPATLEAGEYVFKVAVEDKLTGRANESSRKLTVHPAGSLARGQ